MLPTFLWGHAALFSRQSSAVLGGKLLHSIEAMLSVIDGSVRWQLLIICTDITLRISSTDILGPKADGLRGVNGVPLPHASCYLDRH